MSAQDTINAFETARKRVQQLEKEVAEHPRHDGKIQVILGNLSFAAQLTTPARP